MEHTKESAPGAPGRNGDHKTIRTRQPNAKRRGASAASLTRNGADSQPQTIAPDFDAAPPLLRGLQCWVLWRWEKTKRDHWTKVPYQVGEPGKPYRASTTNPAHRWPFEKAREAFEAGAADGVGYVLGDYGPDVGVLAGADFDDCMDELFGDELPDKAEALRVAKALGGWAELSPTGTGLHVVTLEQQTRTSRNRNGVEVYSTKRFFTFTGRPLPGWPVVPDVPRASLDAARALAGRADAGDDAPRSLDQKPPLGIGMQGARELLDHLPFKWCHEYGDWLRAGMALNHEFGGSAEALELWDEWSQRSPKYDPGACADKWPTFGRPGKEEVTVRTLVRKAEEIGWRAPHTIASAVRDFGLDDWLAGAQAGRFDVHNVPPRDWMFRDVALYGKVLVLAGAGGSSKSFFALTLAAHYVAGKPFDVFEPMNRDPGTDEVLCLFAEEDDDDLHHRYAATMRAAGFDDVERQIVGERLLLRSLLDLDESQALAEYEGHTKRMRAGPMVDMLRKALGKRPTLRWLVLDPLVLLHHLDESDNKGMGQLLHLLGRLAREFRIAIWLVHHFSKSGAQADDLNIRAVRGASAIADNARAALLLRRLDDTDTVELSFAKNSYGQPHRERTFRIVEGGAVVAMPQQPEAVPRQIRAIMRRQLQRDQATEFVETACLRGVLQIVERSPRIGTTAIYEAKPGGYSRKKAEPIVKRAIEDGLLHVEPVGKNKLHTITDDGARYLEGE